MGGGGATPPHLYGVHRLYNYAAPVLGLAPIVVVVVIFNFTVTQGL